MIKEIRLQMKLIDRPSNAVKAVCDVTVHFEELGVIEVSGFRVIERERPGCLRHRVKAKQPGLM